MFGIGRHLVANRELWLKKVIIQPNSNPSHSAKTKHHPLGGVLFWSLQKEGFEKSESNVDERCPASGAPCSDSEN